MLTSRQTSAPARRTPVLFSRDGIFCALLLGLCILITWPVAEIGINDDWAYTLIARDFARTGHFIYHGWTSPILGWQAMWGALFLRLFGPGYTVVRLSNVPIALATALVYHAILRRFGLNRAHAIFGTLTLVLSPLFIPLADSFMTDVSSLFVIFACIYMCQLALAAATDREALAWLAAAALSNIALGTVRQVAWLGVLVVVPCCGWLLRRRRHALALTAFLWLFGAVCIFAVLHWFARQPYSAPESLMPPHQAHGVAWMHLIGNAWRAPLTLLLLCLPVLSAGLAAVWRAPRWALLRITAVITILVVVWLTAPRQAIAAVLLPPWLGNVLASTGIMQGGGLFGSTRSIPPRVLFSALILFVLCLGAFIETLWNGCSAPRDASAHQQPLRWRSISILLLPFACIYCALLAPRAASLGLFDRYLFEIIAVLLIYLLGWHQERISPGMPAISLVVLGLCTVVGVAGTHDLFAMDRARVRLLDTLQRAGVPRPEIRGGFEFDTVTQVMAWGYLNDPRIRNPPDAFKPQPAAYADTNPCRNPYQVYAPVMRPGYVLAADPTPCLNPAPFPPATYRTWLPWATRQLYIGILRQSPTATPGGLPPGTPLTSAK